MFKVKLSLSLIILFGMPSICQSHHVMIDEVNIDDFISLEGRITDVVWQNPHLTIVFQTKDGFGKRQSWLAEAASSKELLSKGISRRILNEEILLSPLKIDVVPSKGSNCALDCLGVGVSMTLSNGHTTNLSDKIINLTEELRY